MFTEEYQNQSRSINLNHIILVLKRRLGVFSLCLIAGIGFGYFILSFVGLKYKAAAQLIYELGAEQVIGSEPGLGQSAKDLKETKALERVIGLLESPSVLKQVALELISDTAIDKTQHPDMTAVQKILTDHRLDDAQRARWLMSQMRADLAVRPEAALQIVTIEYQSKNPQEAADIANRFVKTFMRGRTAARQAVVAEATQWLDDRLNELRGKLTAADQRIETHKLQHKLDNEAAAGIAGIQLRELQREREATKSLYENMLAKVSQTKAQQTLVSSEFRVLVDASPPDRPKTLPIFIWIGGAFAGIALGLCLIIILEYFNDKLISLDDIEKKLSQRLLARLPKINRSDFADDGAHKRRACLSRYHTFAKDYPNSLFADCLIGAKVAIGDSEDTRTRKVVMITSSMPGEGKTQISTNLAAVSALVGEKTLLIDLDLRKEATQSSVKGRRHTECQSKSNAFFESSSITQLVDLTTGTEDYDTIRPRSSAEGAVWLHLFRPQMGQLLEFARQNYDRVWIDTAPAQVFADAIILAKQIDGVIIVAEWSKTTMKQVKDTSALIKNNGGDVLGVIINKIKVDRLISAAMSSYKDYYKGLKKQRRSAEPWSNENKHVAAIAEP